MATDKKQVSPSGKDKTFKVEKHFTELGRKFKPGDTYKPRFKASKRVIARHLLTKRIVEVSEGAGKSAPEDVKEVKESEETKEVENVQGAVPEEQAVKVVVDDGDDFQVEYKGVQFPVKRNQVREDGTLTNGGLKAFKKASS